MERDHGFEEVKKLFKLNFIGPDDLVNISKDMGIHFDEHSIDKIKKIPYPISLLKECAADHILIPGIPLFIDGTPLTLTKLRSFHGFDPGIKEPCFYNQDWYLNEKFANHCTIEFKWYLIRKNLIDKSRGMLSNEFFKMDPSAIHLPSALLCAYVFYAYYYHTKGSVLWSNDYIWCQDEDFQKDQIYVGRYYDPAGLGKNGFSIHRHLSIKNNYGTIPLIE